MSRDFSAFYLRFAATTLPLAPGAHIALALALGNDFGAAAGFLVVLSFGLMQYLILIAMGPLVRSKRILLGGVAVLVLAQLYAARTVFCAASSTAPIAAVVYPIVAAGVIASVLLISCSAASSARDAEQTLLHSQRNLEQRRSMRHEPEASSSRGVAFPKVAVRWPSASGADGSSSGPVPYPPGGF